ncbi:NAD-dependent epimerase/dehydratase family protein [Paenactinomyces guangxiensis]|uniref:NAD(P)-dependent oxidoreductase n=1 Tax=Paenactinomyces guangxiensis TaxID=1490290 RepID=A0A7W1WU64_9BACL|nr:NAD(P)-dependent oxidoreductase [Paenactinomyces guangxiensis]MBA4496094.1 NAD(P)-dependent oxidoreductase [Paenactinomyces guangxiensis]MBH8593181.1 NAD(P)-dependent oxidoreductase [Paenactinomyces guangxiensis]
MNSVQELENKLAEPSVGLVKTLADLDGDILILGVGGKMGPSLARLAKNALNEAGVQKKVIGVSRFSSGNLRQILESDGIETIAADLLNEEQLESLPDVKNVIYMAGNKFGTTGREYFSWAMNAYLPGRVAEKYRHSRMVSFSTGNVYPLTPVAMQGTSEDHPTGPVGEYAQSCLGRERVFEYFSRKYGIPMVQFRLNYAIDLRYGVLLEVARSVFEKKPIDLRMGHVNVIWQGDANEYALRSLSICDSPPRILNVTGPETVSIRWLAKKFGEQFGIEPEFIHSEEKTALLSNASESHRLFGYPRVTLRQMIEWTADWVAAGGETLDKPTHFQERKGAF